MALSHAEDPTSVASFVDTQCQNLIEPHMYEKLMRDKTTFTRGEMLKHKDMTKFHTSEVPKIDVLQDNEVWEIKLRKHIYLSARKY